MLQYNTKPAQQTVMLKHNLRSCVRHPGLAPEGKAHRLAASSILDKRPRRCYNITQHLGGSLVPFYSFIWNDQIEEHLAQHGVAPEEFEEVVRNPDEVGQSRSSGRPIAFGETSTGKYLACVYEFLDDKTVLPVTAYELED